VEYLNKNQQMGWAVSIMPQSLYAGEREPVGTHCTG
jgi:hypothetical protein